MYSISCAIYTFILYIMYYSRLSSTNTTLHYTEYIIYVSCMMCIQIFRQVLYAWRPVFRAYRCLAPPVLRHRQGEHGKSVVYSMFMCIV